MSKVRSFAELRALTDEEIEGLIDARLGDTDLAVGFLREELSRRQAERRDVLMLRYTRTIEQLTWVVTTATIGALVIALVALLLPRSTP